MRKKSPALSRAKIVSPATARAETPKSAPSGKQSAQPVKRPIKDKAGVKVGKGRETTVGTSAAKRAIVKKAGVKKAGAKKIISGPEPRRAVKKRPAKAKAMAMASKTGKLVGSEVVKKIFARFAEIEPEPKGELHSVNTYTLLVAVVLSAQATDAGVNRATGPLFKVADSPQKMVALGEDKVRDFIKTIGLYRNKASNVIALSKQLIAQFGGEVPAERAALEALPGVGRKTANVVLNIAFGQPTMAVDTHVFRVANRIGLASGKTPLEIEEALVARIPPAYAHHAHHWLILHGRYLCKARKPECWRCPIAEYCLFEPKTRAP